MIVSYDRVCGPISLEHRSRDQGCGQVRLPVCTRALNITVAEQFWWAAPTDPLAALGVTLRGAVTAR